MKKYADIIVKYLIITLGTALVGFSLSCFMAFNNIISGGISGLATIINHFTSFPIGILSLIFNIPIFIWGVAKLGKSLGMATFYGTIALSVFTDIFSLMGRLTDDLLLASVFGGLLGGIGYGMVFYVNATTGGVDILAKIAQLKYRHIQLGKIILIMDILIIGIAMAVYGDINIGLYSVISLWITSYVLDLILEGFGFAKLIFIISDYSQNIAECINKKLERGATLLVGFGSYTGDRKNVIMCTIKKNEIPVLKDYIKAIDSNAFVLITDVREALGEGFLRR